MHDIKWIREEPQGLIDALARRGGDTGEARAEAEKLVSLVRGLDEARRRNLTDLEAKLARRNAASKEIGAAKARKDEVEAQALMAEVANLKADIPTFERDVKEIEKSINDALAAIPNAPLAEVPLGKDEHDNVERSVFGEKRAYAFTPKQHFEVGEGLGLMDFETAAKLSGARFVVNKGPLARLERALGQFFLDVHTGEHGYTEVNPPLLVRDDIMYGTAQLPKFKDDQFIAIRKRNDDEISSILTRNMNDFIINLQFEEAGRTKFSSFEEYNEFRYRNEAKINSWLNNQLWAELENESLWLIPTAEVPLTNLIRESILSEEELPLRLTALTPCFRAEAGAAGRDTRGMIRQHQFNKVELVSITTPEQSAAEHERMLACAEAVLQKLDLHYRVVTLCTGDMGFASRKTYDIEVWLPGQGAYREISSCSVCGDFQARRMDARYRPKEAQEGGKAGAKAPPRFVHTLNGSGVAVGRALVAVLETYQQEDGSVVVPEVLKPYMGGLTKIEKA